MMMMIAGGSREDSRAQVLLGKVEVGSIFGKAKVGSTRLRCQVGFNSPQLRRDVPVSSTNVIDR